MVVFCSRTGSLVTLSNGRRTALRNHPAQEFNNGVVLSEESLKDNQLFEVRIDKKINSWSGSIEIGVTTSDPVSLTFPTSATGFREGTWIMSGCSVLKDGHTSLEEYGQDLDQLGEGDRIGILRTAQGCLHFYVNGIDQGQAATNIPAKVYAVVDMYGKCAQVSVVDDVNRETLLQNEFTNEMIQEASFAASNDKLIFHEKTGTLVKLSNGRRTAERRRPLDEFNNGVVMTARPIKDDEMFEIRIDRLVDKWSGSIEVGITTHNPTNLDFPATMTNMRSGTIMMSGCGILTNGKGTRREYGDFNLDELADADRIGLMRKSNGALHYYINGEDQGVAATRTPSPAWGVVDLYGMAVKVTIIDNNDPDYNELTRPSVGNLTNRANEFIRQLHDEANSEDEDSSQEEVEKLLFHPHCGNHAAVINGGKTAHRPNAVDDFNNGVVLTSRYLKPNEMFDVKIDKLVDKWAGSIEIGVTTHSPLELDYPSTMTNIRTGTWMMTGNGVMHNGTTVLDEYGQNLDRLKIGDRVGALRKADGTVHFFVNGIDQGAAASDVPANVYGVIDLYGQAAQATIVDHTDNLNSPTQDIPSVSSLNTELLPIRGDELRFHHRTGRNANILPDGRSAIRPNARGEFNDAIVMSNRPLKDNELFEVSIDKMVDRWSGSIEAGVTLIHPDDLELPSTMTDIDYDTWMLSGSAVMQDGSTIKNGYRLDLDTLQLGSRIGMMRASDGTLHFYLDGEDMGVACSNVPSGIYAVIDLYGQCAEVAITQGSIVMEPEVSNVNTQDIEISLTSPISAAAQITHSFSDCCGKNISLVVSGNTATRLNGYNHSLLFSADPLRVDELFEVKVLRLCSKWSGSLCIGLTTFPVTNSTSWSVLPATAVGFKNKPTWLLVGADIKKCGTTVKENYAPSLDRLRIGDKIGVRRFRDATMHIFVNGEDMGIASTNIPKNVFAVIDLFGQVDQVSITSSYAVDMGRSVSLSRPPSIHSTSSSENSREDDLDEDTAEACYLEFQVNHGKNIELSNKNLTATRTASYNHGLVFTDKPLLKNHQFKIRIEKLNRRWTSSLLLGVVDFNPEKYNLPVCATAIKKSTWVIQGDSVFQSGSKIKENYGVDLDSLQIGYTVGLLIDDDNCLHLYVNDLDQGIAAIDLPPVCYGVIDLYGECEQVTVVSSLTDEASQQHEYKEKANMEEGVKEKKVQRHIEVSKSPKNCDYQNLCNRFRTFLGLPDGYFNSSYNCCFCDTCHKVRGDSPYHKKGEPPRDVAVPLGWYKFGLRMSPKAECLNVFKKWHMAYHGTVVPALRRILDTSDLTLAEDISMGSLTLQTRLTSQFDEKNKPEEEEDAKQISLSPTLRYAGCEKFAPAFEFRDPKSKKVYKGRVAFQVCVKPGSYKTCGQSLGINEQIDPKFSNNEVEWSTKEKGAVTICALLVKVD